VLSQSVEDLLNVLQVFFPTLVEDEDVIQIYNHKGIGEGPQDVIHQPHEGGWGIRQAKGHDQPLEKTFFRLESSLPYISLFYGDLVVVRLQINLTKVLGPLELVEKVINLGNWVPIPDCDFVQSSVINTKSPGPIFLLYEHDWASTG
jgi:hypothetical protein